MYALLATAVLACAPSGAQDAHGLAPFGAIPSERQLRWHDRTFYAFVHFGPNTFTGVEWGEGREKPEVFQPTELDARQWARAFARAGMTGVVITAKHHDGFCLWPSSVTGHDVASSPWAEGRGDVLRSLSEACKAEGLWFGVYLSPWDRHEATYGSGEAYDDHFVHQLTEALTQYGDVAEVWFDGACGEGPNGKRQVYDWPRYVQTVREHQPGAVIFSDAGPDVRWCGNERAIGNETNWATLNRDKIEIGTGKTDELNKGHRGGSHWVPYECNTSIRPGWFWKAGLDNDVKSIDQLLDTWYASVGRGGNFLLNVPPDQRGLITEVDTRRLALMGDVLTQTHAIDLLADAVRSGGVSHDASDVRGAESSHGRFAPVGLVDPSRRTFWSVDDDHDAEGPSRAWVEFRLPDSVTFDEIWLEEPIQLGQRIERFRVRIASEGSEWRDVAAGTTIGARRILRVDECAARRIRVEILASLATPALSRLSLYRSPPRVAIEPATSTSLSPIAVSMTARDGAVIRYTLDGTEVTSTSPEFTGELRVAASASLRARAFTKAGPAPWESRAEYTVVSDSDWKSALQFIKPPDPGLRVQQYGGAWQTLDQMARRKPEATKKCTGFDLSMRSRGEMCALAFEGFVEVPKDGLYTFATTSDDGSRAYIHGELIVENDGLHGMAASAGQVALRAGFHPIRVEWFNARGGFGLEVRWSGPGVGRDVPIPADALYR